MNPICCPLCRSSFIQTSPHALCSSGHSFDRAKEGYLNLLPVHKKNSKEPGDSREQLRARQLFLEAGHYHILLDNLVSLLPSAAINLIDIGCGEGYFTRGICQAMPEGANVLGVDIAKEGVRLAAQANRRQGLNADYIVASNFDLPYQTGQADAVVRIFAPSRDAELHRVLKTGGLLIIVAPAPKHLINFRQAIYHDVLDHEAPQLPEGFSLVKQHQATGTIELEEPEQILSLLRMTPFSWRMPESQKQEIAKQAFSDVISFDYSVYQKN